MEKKSTQKLLCYAGAGLMFLYTGYILIVNVMNLLDYFTMTGFLRAAMGILAAGLLGMGLATQNRKFVMFGAVLKIIQTILTQIFNIPLYIRIVEYIGWDYLVPTFIGTVLGLIPMGILAFMANSGKKQKFLPVLLLVCEIAMLLYSLFTSDSFSDSFNWASVLQYAGIVVAGFAVSGMEDPVPAPAAARQTASTAAAGPDKYERLKQLKTLLDMGAISQEEFDQKKKEIIYS